MNLGIPNIQNVALKFLGSAGASVPRDVTQHNRFGFTVEVLGVLAADMVLKFQSAPGSVADPCLPGAFTDVLEVAICKTPAVGALSTLTIPAGTPVGTICAGTIPCRTGKFLQAVVVSGSAAGVFVGIVLQGPHA
jgi:hypothetical protein